MSRHHTRNLTIVISAFSVFGVAACAPSLQGSLPNTMSPAEWTHHPTSSAADYITRREIAEVEHATNAREVIEVLRPAFLRPRISPSRGAQGETASVYVDGVRYGGLDALQGIESAQINEIRYFKPADARLYFGPDHVGGVIAVTTIKKGRAP